MYLQLLDKKNLRLNTESQRSPFGLRSELYTLSDHFISRTVFRIYNKCLIISGNLLNHTICTFSIFLDLLSRVL